MKRKLFIVLFALALLFNVVSLTSVVFAEEPVPNTAEQETVTDGEQTFFSRLTEAWESGDVMDAAVIVWGIVNTLFMLVLKKQSTKDSKLVRSDVKSNTAATNQKTNELISSVNAADETVKALSQRIEQFLPEFQKALQEARVTDAQSIQLLEQKVAQCIMAIVTFAEMMQTVYSGSSTLPRPTKDLVNSKYLKVVTALSEMEKQGNAQE